MSVLRELVSDHDFGRAAAWSQEERWRVPFLDLLNKPDSQNAAPGIQQPPLWCCGRRNAGCRGRVLRMAGVAA